MTGAGLWGFLITIIGLLIIGVIIFTAIDFIVTDERFKKIAKLAVGGVMCLAFLMAIGSVLGFGGASAQITPLGLIYFAIGVIVLLVVWYLITKFFDMAANWFPPIAPLKDIIMFVVSAIMLIVLLLMAANLLFGAAIGGSSYSPFRSSERHGSLLGHAAWASAGAVRELPSVAYA
jgi:hypothetical protein